MTAPALIGLPDDLYGEIRGRYAGKRAAFAAVPLGGKFRIAVFIDDREAEFIPAQYGEFGDATKAWERADRLNLYVFGMSQRKAADIITPLMRRKPDLFGFRPAEAPT